MSFLIKNSRASKEKNKDTPKDAPKAKPETEVPKDPPLKRESFKEARKKLIADSNRIKYGKVITKKKLESNLKLGQNGVGELTTHLFNEDAFGLNVSYSNGSYFSRSENQCGFKMNGFVNENSTIHEQGGTFYHECWHAIDNNYGDSQAVDIYGFPDASVYMSTHMTLSTGKTFMTTLIEEYSQVNEQELKNAIKNDIDSYFKEKYGMTKDEVIADYDVVKKKASELYTKNFNEYWEYVNTEEYIKKQDAFFETRVEYPAKVRRKWADMSDVVNGATNGNSTLVDVGHFDFGYWNNSTRAKEAFAEIASSKATNPASYDVFKKYLPNTVKAFEEIYNGLESGKIKSRGRKNGRV